MINIFVSVSGQCLKFYDFPQVPSASVILFNVMYSIYS